MLCFSVEEGCAADRETMFGSRRKQRAIALCLGLGLAILALWGCADDQDTAPPATPTPLSPYAADMLAQGYVELVGDDLAAAPLPPEPSQSELGAEPYRQICLACHGDWGQGLTDEWRAEWGEDSNCWQSRCHAPNHPDYGFQLPRSVPAVLGAGSLVRFDTAAEMRENIAESMPWWNPGSLSEEQTWTLTAYLMEVRGEIGRRVELNEANATAYRLHVPYRPTPDPRPGVLLVVAALAAATAGLIWRRRS
jgi:mono/diheme cytochrome c family protein